jgi:hypothetical protein
VPGSVLRSFDVRNLEVGCQRVNLSDFLIGSGELR